MKIVKIISKYFAISATVTKGFKFLAFYLSFLLGVRVSDEYLSGEWRPFSGSRFLGRRTFGQNPQCCHLCSEFNTICDGYYTVGISLSVIRYNQEQFQFVLALAQCEQTLTVNVTLDLKRNNKTLDKGFQYDWIPFPL